MQSYSGEKHITVYSTAWCPDCKRAKRFLGEQRIPYINIDIEQEPAAMAYVEKVNNGKRIIPTIVFPDGSILVASALHFLPAVGSFGSGHATQPDIAIIKDNHFGFPDLKEGTLMSAARVLIVEDEENIRFFLTNLLQDEGYRIWTAANGQLALSQLAAEQFDLAILDLNLGAGMDGMEVLAALREQCPGTAVILLTGYATVETAITALRQGASDYLLKPSPAEQIIASVRQALLKRQGEQQRRTLLAQLEQGLAGLRTIEQGNIPASTSPETAKEEERLLQQGDVVIDLARHLVTIDDQLLETSPAEFDFLVYLLSQAPRVISTEEIIRQVYQYEAGLLQDSEAVRALVYRLRSKIKESTGRTNIIRTVRGVGYAIGP